MNTAIEVELHAILEKLSSAELREAVSLLLSRLRDVDEGQTVEKLPTDVIAVRSGSPLISGYDG